MAQTIKKISKFELIDLIVVYIIGIIELILLGHHFCDNVWLVIWPIKFLWIFVFVVLVLFLILFKTFFKLYKKEWKIIDKKENINLKNFIKVVFFSITFGFLIVMLFSLDFLPLLINTYKNTSTLLSILIIVFFGLLIFLNLLFTHVNKSKLFGYILNIGLLFYFYAIIKVNLVIIIILLVLILVNIFFSCQIEKYFKLWLMALVSLIILLLGVILLTGLFSMDYNQKNIVLLGNDANIVCSPNDFNLILENSLIDCNITDRNLAVDSIKVYSKSKDSTMDEIHLTDYDENKLIMCAPQNIYELKILSNNNEYIAKNLKLMTIEDYEKNRKDFGKYFFLLLSVIFLTIPTIVKSYLDIKKEIK